MNAAQFAGIFRAVLAAAGGYFVASGKDPVTVSTISGALLTVGTAVWSFFTHKKIVVPPAA
jgi:hypothetical protein